MLKKMLYPISNNSSSVLTVVSCAKRRRYMARCAVRAVNSKLGIRPKLAVIK